MIILFLLLGLTLLYFGAEWLVKGSSRIALRYGISSLVVGLTVVAFGTSAPELVVSLKAALGGLGDISIGNVVGSNIFNIAVILGISAIISPIKVNLKVIRMDMPIVIGATFILIYFLLDKMVSRIEAILLLCGIVAYTLNTIRSSKKESLHAETLNGNGNLGPAILPNVVYTIMGLLFLVAGSHFFVEGAVNLARIIGVSDAVIALTIVAAGTSLPELATSVVAAVRKEEDIAIGNIIGSNIFNIFAILGVSGSIAVQKTEGIGFVDLGFMAGTAILLLPLMKTGFRISRAEGAVLLSLYGGYLWYLWP